MTTKLITGREGSGKTFEIEKRIIDDIQNKIPVLLIVPSSQTVATEAKLFEKIHNANLPMLNLEIASFPRLANSVFRMYGGLCYNYIGNGAKKVILWKSLKHVLSALKVYKKITLNDDNTLSLIMNEIEALKAQGLKPEDLLRISSKIHEEENESILADKLDDIALIYSSYSNYLNASFDDPSDDLTRLDKMLINNEYFKGKSVYLDSFDRYNANQLSIISHMIRQAESVTVSFPFDTDTYKNYGDMYQNIVHYYKEINRIANKHNCKVEHVNLTENHRTTSQELINLSKHIWDDNIQLPITTTKTEQITLWQCEDEFSQAEAVAIEIMKNITGGSRFSDNVIICHDTSNYKGIIDAILAKYEIPCFVTHKIELIEQSLPKMLLSVCVVICNDFQTEDVISYLKTGLSGLSDDEIDIIEEYSNTWDLSSSDWTSEEEWMMNPDGYCESITEEALNRLDVINSIRGKLIQPIISLKENIIKGQTVKSCVKSIMQFLEEIKATDMLPQNQQNADIWNAMIKCFQELVDSSDEEPVTLAEFANLLGIMFKASDFGVIPTSKDEVIITDAKRITSGEFKYCYIIGSVEGEFPASVTENDIFNDVEKERLQENGLSLKDTMKEKMRDEFFFYQRALNIAINKICIFYYTHSFDGSQVKPSYAVTRIKNMFPNVVCEEYNQFEDISKIFSPEITFENLQRFNGTELGTALQNIYRNIPQYSERIDAFSIPFSTQECSVSGENANKLFGGDIELTSTKFENYANCQFSFFCQNILHLSESKKAELKNMQIGNFSHKILENFLTQYILKSGNLSNEEIEKLVDDIIEQYLKKLFEHSKKETKRVEQLFRRLRRNSILLIHSIIDELSESGFRPKTFEITFGKNSPIEPLKISLDDGSLVSFCGKIDRIDTIKEGNSIFVRVIDYKSSEHTFSLDLVKSGTNVQILLYLMAICKNTRPEFIQTLGGSSEDSIIPASAVYSVVNPTKVDASICDEEESINNSIKENFKQNGFLLNDFYEKIHSGDVTKATVSSKDSKKKTVSSVSSDEIYDLFNEVENSVVTIISNLKRGKADAVPNDDNKCIYCPAKYICRNKIKSSRKW